MACSFLSQATILNYCPERSTIINIFEILRNSSYSLLSNFISLFVSLFVIVIIPKLIGVEAYGYWQLYLFYSSFVGFLHFGWNDGIYLRHGGKKYAELDKNLFFSQFIMLTILQLAIAISVFLLSMYLVHDYDRAFIFKMLVLSLFLFNTRSMLLFVLLGSNRIKEYAQITTFDRVIYLIVIGIILALGIRDFKLLIFADVIGKAASLSFSVVCCKDIVFRSMSSFYFSFREAADNISVGIKLMFANIASMLIIGAVRFGIERSWDVATFGRVSLILSISSLMMLFISTLSVVMYPVLRRVHVNKLPDIYVLMRNVFMPFLLGLLLTYFPLKVLLSIWLPHYLESFFYMAVLFPIFIYEGKTVLLINTYLKALRKESILLKVNLLSLFFSILLTVLSTVIFKNLNLAVISIILILAFRSICAEIILSDVLSIASFKHVLMEASMTLVFALSGWFIDSWYTVLIYSSVYLIYLAINRKDIIKSLLSIRNLVRHSSGLPISNIAG